MKSLLGSEHVLLQRPSTRGDRTFVAPPRASRSSLKVQIFELFAGWHHTKYIASLMPTLIQLRREGHVTEIVLTTTASHVASPFFEDLLAEFTTDITLDLIQANHESIQGSRVTGYLIESVQRVKPDYLISTSANNGAFMLAMRSLMRNPLNWSGEMTSIGILHNGFAETPQGFVATIQDSIQRFSRHFSPWTELHVVNPMLYDVITARRKGTQQALRLLPDPVEAFPQISRFEARERLSIPTSGRYLGQIGKSDSRKAIPELLAAFRAANLPNDHRLLLAGDVYSPYRTHIQAHFQDLVNEGRIIILDRYLKKEEFHTAYCALDVISIAYYTNDLSGNLLAAIGAQRPVITGCNGYTGFVVKESLAGWTVDVRDIESFSKTIAQAMSASNSFFPSENSAKLMAFHDPKHFADTLLRKLYERLNLSTTHAWT